MHPLVCELFSVDRASLAALHASHRPGTNAVYKLWHTITVWTRLFVVPNPLSEPIHTTLVKTAVVSLLLAAVLSLMYVSLWALEEALAKSPSSSPHQNAKKAKLTLNGNHGMKRGASNNGNSGNSGSNTSNGGVRPGKKHGKASNVPDGHVQTKKAAGRKSAKPISTSKEHMDEPYNRSKDIGNIGCPGMSRRPSAASSESAVRTETECDDGDGEFILVGSKRPESHSAKQEHKSKVANNNNKNNNNSSKLGAEELGEQSPKRPSPTSERTVVNDTSSAEGPAATDNNDLRINQLEDELRSYKSASESHKTEKSELREEMYLLRTEAARIEERHVAELARIEETHRTKMAEVIEKQSALVTSLESELKTLKSRLQENQINLERAMRKEIEMNHQFKNAKRVLNRASLYSDIVREEKSSEGNDNDSNESRSHEHTANTAGSDSSNNNNNNMSNSRSNNGNYRKLKRQRSATNMAPLNTQDVLYDSYGYPIISSGAADPNFPASQQQMMYHFNPAHQYYYPPPGGSPSSGIVDPSQGLVFYPPFYPWPPPPAPMNVHGPFPQGEHGKRSSQPRNRRSTSRTNAKRDTPSVNTTNNQEEDVVHIQEATVPSGEEPAA